MNPIALAHCLTHPRDFSKTILDFPLHEYQIEPITAVLNSVLSRNGLDFLIVMPRQSGKNEAIAHLLTQILNLTCRVGGNTVFGATGDAAGRGRDRLEARLNNKLNQSQWTKKANPSRRCLGNGAVVFLSTHQGAASRGETAHWLLVIDEMQDQNATHIEQVFEPMRAANNATAVYIGTVKFSHDALWQKKIELERLEAQDGIKRIFFVLPEQVIAENDAYSAFLAGKLAKFGRNHPIIASEYFLEPIDGAGGLFPPRRIALMRGSHSRQRQPQPGKIYVATLDTAGQDEQATDPVAALANPKRDYTIATIWEIEMPTNSTPGPTYRAIDIFADHGSRHFEDVPGKPKLADRLTAFFNHWGILHLISDATGVGEGLTSHLTAVLSCPVTAFKFSAKSKALLGSRLLSIIELGKFLYWTDDETQIMSDGWWFWRQVEACSYEIPPDGRFDTDLKWEVKPSHKTNTPMGDQPTHDDRLLSAALIAEIDRLSEEGKIILATSESAIIPAIDPIANLNYS